MKSHSILNTVGNTKLVCLNNILNNYTSQLYLKLERTNPGGSIKDRPALYLIENAERCGLLKPGGTIIESSSGNFGISLAMIGAAKGYRVIILVDPKTTAANLRMLKAYGAEVIVVTEQDDSGSYHKTRIALANKLHKEIPNSFRPDQCFNLKNSDAHYFTTASELLSQAPGHWDYIITAVSTGGQIGGLSRYFAEHSPQTKLIVVDINGSTIFGGCAHAYLVPGVGLSWTPANISNLSLINTVYKISDEQAFVSCRTLVKEEGIMLGGSSGACVYVGLHLATMNENKNIAVIAADSGERYLDTIYNDEWIQTKNFSLDKDSSNLLNMVRRLEPYSTNPPQVANYKPELEQQLR